MRRTKSVIQNRSVKRISSSQKVPQLNLKAIKELRLGSSSPGLSSNSFRIKSRRSLLSITQAIEKHVQKRLDVEIIINYDKYHKQFFSKCKRLQSYLYKVPNAKEKYLNEANPHFKYAMQFLMLDLFRKGVITQGSYDNMRKQAVQAIEDWIFGWIQRQMIREQLQKKERQQLNQVLGVLDTMDKYLEEIQIQESPF